MVALKRRSWDLYWYYSLWQWALARRAKQLHHEVGFDVAHHVTFANDWLPCGLAVLTVPLIWGPVGGASRYRCVAVPALVGLSRRHHRTSRGVVTGLSRRLFTDAVARRAALVVAQNEAVAHRFADSRRVVVEPNACLAPSSSGSAVPTADAAPPSAVHRRHTALFVARLNAWKGGRLAVAVMAHPRIASWDLRVYGDGYERRALERLSQDFGVADRVCFMGHRPRAEVLAAYAEADALFFPSLHDQAGWVVAEASSVGCPVGLPATGRPTDPCRAQRLMWQRWRETSSTISRAS